MRGTALVRIDLSALRNNLTVVRNLCVNSKVMAMIKANAYGHGLLSVAAALETADGFAVARLEEALQLRAAGFKQRVLLLGTFLTESDVSCCSRQGIEVTAHDPRSVAVIASQAKTTPVRVWLELDSGMHRLGLDPRAFIAANQLLSKEPGVLELIHMTHFSSSYPNEITDHQIRCFSRCHNKDSTANSSLANSAALIARADTHADWVRPGIMLYGENPLGSDYPLPLRATMRLSSRLIAVREIEAGEGVGYNARWISCRPSRIGTVGIGYGDGYPRHAPNGTPVWINGSVVPLVGQVSMDSLAVDLTGCAQTAVGDEVVLWGPELSSGTVAAHANTISHELFTSVTIRVQREYSGEYSDNALP